MVAFLPLAFFVVRAVVKAVDSAKIEIFPTRVLSHAKRFMTKLVKTTGLSNILRQGGLLVPGPHVDCASFVLVPMTTQDAKEPYMLSYVHPELGLILEGEAYSASAEAGPQVLAQKGFPLFKLRSGELSDLLSKLESGVQVYALGQHEMPTDS